MSDSMYDRLGDMLSDALESGDFFSADGAAEKQNIGGATKKNEHEYERIAGGEKQRRKPTAAEKDALALLGLDENATLDDAKKAYHEKLKHYHPDRHGENPVLQKVAREKTRQVLEAWQTLLDFFA